jgi:hypothetical protein
LKIIKTCFRFYLRYLLTFLPCLILVYLYVRVAKHFKKKKKLY